MRVFLVLLAVLLALGARFSGDGPSPDRDERPCRRAGCGCDVYSGWRWPADQAQVSPWPAPGETTGPIRDDAPPPP